MSQSGNNLQYGYRLLGSPEFIEITKSDFEQLGLAQKNSLITLGIEEKFDMLLYNFIDFEQVLLNLAVRNSLFREDKWSPSMNQRLLVNRHLANLLMTCILYLDQLKHDFKSVLDGDQERLEELNKFIHAEYDENFSYRLMAAIRNYMQHRNIPIHGIRYSGAWKPANTGDVSSFKRLEFKISPWIEPDNLTNDKKFKKSVLEELSTMGETVNLVPHVRRYIESLGRIHEYVRETLKPHIEEFDRVIDSHFEKVREAFNKKEFGGFHIVMQTDSNDPLKETYIFSEAIVRRKSLEQKNQSLGSIASRCVTSCQGDQRIMSQLIEQELPDQ